VEAIERLRRDPCKDKSFSNLFRALASVAVAKKAPRETWEGLWAGGTNKTWKALKGFPKRLREMSDEVKQVSTDTLFDFDVMPWITKETAGAQVLKQRLRQLPGLLQLYADFLEMMTKRLPIVFLEREGIPSRKGRNSRSVLLLSKLVEALTGRFCDEEVANLLNAAARALGESFEIEALDLAQARYRCRAGKRSTA